MENVAKHTHHGWTHAFEGADACIVGHPLIFGKILLPFGFQSALWGTMSTWCKVSLSYIFNRVVSWSWHTHDKPYGKFKPHSHFFLVCVVLSDLERGLSLPTEHNSFEIQTCLATHIACACISIVCDSSQLAFALGQVIWLDLVSTLGRGLS